MLTDRPTLTLTVGLPRSGKTTWARAQGCPVVCPDEVRIAMHGQRFAASAEPLVWAVVKIMVVALFRAGHAHVILDATNITKKRRDEWLDGMWWTSAHVIDTPKEECIRRALAEGDTEIIPVIERMAKQYEPIPEPPKPTQPNVGTQTFREFGEIPL